jgi:hypothetical protein
MRLSSTGAIPTIYRAGPAPDGSGLEVLLPAGSLQLAKDDGTTIEHLLGSQVALQVKEGSRPILASGRQDDTSPFWGGASIRDVDNQTVCSTGFRVHSGTTYYMVTAWHCSDGGTDTFHTYPGTGTYVGAVVESAHSTDVELLGGAAYGLSVYTGAYGTSTATQISGAEEAVVGDTVCMEGSLSGAVCNNEVTAVDQDVDYGGAVGIIYDLTLAENQGGTSAAGEGDSGGPVLMSPSSSGEVTGMIQGLEPPFSACTGYDGGRDCSEQVYFATFSTIDSEFNVAVG